MVATVHIQNEMGGPHAFAEKDHRLDPER